MRCRLKNGAIPLIGYPPPGQPVLIDPYFANLACLGLLCAQLYAPDPRTLPYVAHWLEWYAANLAGDYTIARFEGRRSADGDWAPGATPLTPESHASYAATFLSVAGAYQKASPAPLTPMVIEACCYCFGAVSACTDANRLYWNYYETPRGKVRGQYLLENIEVYQGLVAATQLFEVAGIEPNAKIARGCVRHLSKSLHEFCFPRQKYVVDASGDKTYREEALWEQPRFYAKSLNTVSALAFFDNISPTTRSALWTKWMATHAESRQAGSKVADSCVEEPTIERIYLAGRRAALPGEQAALRAQLRQRADELLRLDQEGTTSVGYGRAFPLIHRYALMILALVREDIHSQILPRIPLDRTKDLVPVGPNAAPLPIAEAIC